MEEIDNLSIKSFSTFNSIDNESTDNEINNEELTNNKSTDKEINNEELTNNKSTDKESTNNKSTDKELNNEESTAKKSIAKELNDNQINFNNNQQSETKSTDLNFIDELNKSANLKNDKTKSIDCLLFENEWILKLDLNFKVQLFNLFSEYTRLLVSNEEILIDEKELLEKNKNDLIKLLNKPPLKLDEESKSYKAFINLDNIFKHKIIDQLIKNENLIIYYKNKIDTNLKNKLIEENNFIITKLINLPIQYLNNDVSLVDDEELKSNQSECKDEKLVNKLEIELSNFKNETINLKEEFNKLKRELDDEKLDNKNQLNNDTIVLKEELSKMKSKLDDEIFKNENLMNQLNQNNCINNTIKLYCAKKDMKNFFENGHKFCSEPITFLNIQWYIKIYSKYDDDDKKRYLAFFLHVRNKIDDVNNVKWKCLMYYDLILKNNLPDKEDKVLEFDYTFAKSEGRGSRKFISEDELFNLENGFIKDDSIKLEVNLKVDKIERNI